jgi:hypothetical protein
MTRFIVFLSLFFCFPLSYFCQGADKARSFEEKLVGKFSSCYSLIVQKNNNGQWGITVRDGNSSVWFQSQPVMIEHYLDSTLNKRATTGYDQIETTNDGFSGSSAVQIGEVTFLVNDFWRLSGNTLTFSRKLKVNGNAPGGFLSSTSLAAVVSRGNYRYFVPGMIYGKPEVISADAIGGINSGNDTWIREDRLPAPLFGVYAKNGHSLTILDPAPKGNTTKEDSRDRQVRTLTDERFKFGALGAGFSGDTIRIGIKWPGTEGGTTYRGYFYPGGQVHRWRQRFHPLKDGLEQDYSIIFRFEEDKRYAEYYPRAWRWAWEVLKPQVNRQNIELASKSLTEILADQVETHKGISGLSNMITFEEGFSGKRKDEPFGRTVMGFTGKALEAANYLLRASDLPGNPRAEEFRTKGNAIINSFLTLKLGPPEGEGFYWQTGKPAPALPRNRPLYIRSFGDDLKALLKAAKREKSRGREHPEWIAWTKSFADWLLPQQHANGGFPRGWVPVTGEIADSSLQSTYNVIPFLILQSELSDDSKYLDAAIKAGEFAWANGQSEGIFVGGTIDNPNVVDKEAGTLSLEAYLALYSVTKSKKWLDRAQMAAAFAETWIYIWNVPMPDDESSEDLHWKKGVSTIGLQLISTGHSLVDAYMAFDADEFAKLSVWANDPHSRKVAEILLHNTKGMLAVPGRLYDLPGTGWQQEHWSLAPERGLGRKRAWLPWVTTSHLNGIFDLEEYDKELFKKLVDGK